MGCPQYQQGYWQVERGLFKEMAEQSPSYLDSSDYFTDDQHTKPCKRPPVLWDIMDWVQCFGVYIAIVSVTKSLGVFQISLAIRESSWERHCIRVKEMAVVWLPFLLESISFKHQGVVHHKYHHMKHNFSKKKPFVVIKSQGSLPYQSRPPSSINNSPNLTSSITDMPWLKWQS